jgi:hypothetical protein
VHSLRCIALLSLGVAWFFGARPASSQEPAPPATTASPNGTAAAPQPATSGKQKYNHANDFLIRGSVFTDKARAFPGVKLRIRRSGEQKFRWEDYTNSRGEFAMRVPQGAEYEMVVHAKGFVDQTKVVDAKSGIADTTLAFQLQPTGGKK